MDPIENIQTRLGAIGQIADAGFAMALHIRFTTPSFLFQSYSDAWHDYYSRNGLVMHDPTVRWGFENSGVVSWSKLAANDPMNVLGAAKDHGMAHGLTYATQASDSHSVASFSHSTREFDTAEQAELLAQVDRIHAETLLMSGLPKNVVASLKKLSIRTTLA